MTKTPILLLTVLIPLINIAAFDNLPSVSQDNDSLTSKVDALFAEWDNTNSPGCALAVIKDGEIIYKR